MILKSTHHKVFHFVTFVLIFQFLVSQIPVYGETNVQFQQDSGSYQPVKLVDDFPAEGAVSSGTFDLNEFLAVIRKNLDYEYSK